MTKSILDLIGNTPMVDVSVFSPNPKVRIFAKLEWTNPTGSIKDRVAKYMIEHAEKRGELTPDKIILESTSGNMGISLATLGKIKNYQVRLTMSESKSLERRKIIRMLGADLVLTSKENPHSNIEKANQLYEDDPQMYYFVNQNENEDNWKAHFNTTGVEILDQMNGKIDGFISGIGTGGTVTGVGRRLKAHLPDVHILSVEPKSPHHQLEGLTNTHAGYIPPILDTDVIDERCYISDNTAIDTAKQLYYTLGLFVGISSGAALAAAIKQSAEMTQGNLVIIFADHGFKYLSTQLFNVPS